jgi:hypothetical protein
MGNEVEARSQHIRNHLRRPDHCGAAVDVPNDSPPKVVELPGGYEPTANAICGA